MTKLTSEFRKWWKGSGRILKIQQGDDNLIAVMFRNVKNFSVGIYKQAIDLDFPSKKTFKLIEMIERLDLNGAEDKFNRIIKEF